MTKAMVRGACSLAVAMVAAAAPAERLPIRAFTTADGLPSDQVRDVVEDRRGFLWFATRHGLSRFDGYEFTNYGTAHGLPSPEIFDLFEDRERTLWVATAAGLGRLRPAGSPSAGRLLERFAVGTSEETNNVWRLFEDRGGQLWAGTLGGLFRLRRDGDRLTTELVPLPLARYDGEPSVRCFAEGPDGSFWLGTNRGVARRFADGRIEHYPVVGAARDDRVYDLLLDRRGRLWMATTGAGVFVAALPAPGDRLAPEGITLEETARRGGPPVDGQGAPRMPERPGDLRQFTRAQGLTHDTARSGLLQTADGRIWIGTFGGVTIYEAGHWRRLRGAQGLVEEETGAKLEDRAGNVWLAGFGGGGAMRLEAEGFISFDERDGLGSNLVRAVVASRAGELLAVSGLEPAFLSRRSEESFVSWVPSLPPGVTLGWGWGQIAAEDPDGDWWFGGNRLLRFRRPARLEDLGRMPPHAVYSPALDVFRVYADRRGDVWVGTYGPRYLSRFEHSSQSFRHYTTADGVPDDVPIAFAEDAAGRLWVGFSSAGLARRRGERFDLFTVRDGLPPGPLGALLLDRAGRLWVASQEGGVAVAADPSAERPGWRRYTAAAELSSDQVESLAEDAQGRIYLGTGRGVDRLDPANGRIRRYTSADGLARGPVTVAHADPGGAIWFGTRQGLSRLRPVPERPSPPPPIFITGLRVAGEPRPISELGEEQIAGLVLRPDESQVEIDFVGLSFAPAERLRYQFRLEGAAWSEPNEQRSVVLANLAPGRFRFAVRALSAAGVASARPATVSFELLPPFWRRGWFLLLAASALGLLAYSYHRQRLARLLAVERVRTRIATDLHDDLGASLSRIAILSEVVEHQVGEGAGAGAGPGAGPRLREIAETARGMVAATSDIVWSIDPRRDHLASVVARLRGFAGEVLDPQGVVWSLDAPANGAAVALPPEQRRHLFLILKEAVHNAARHAQARQVEITVEVAGGRLRAEVRDDGCGFTPPAGGVPPPEDEGGNGLRNMHVRARALGGVLRLESAPRGGTRVLLEAPLG